MMLETNETVDGIAYAITEIDAELYCHIPELKRRKCTPRVMQEVDELLDTRNDLLAIGRLLLVDEFVFSDEFEYLTNGGM